MIVERSEYETVEPLLAAPSVKFYNILTGLQQINLINLSGGW